MISPLFPSVPSAHRAGRGDAGQEKQGHFDIGEVVARQLRKAILERKSKINKNNVYIIDSLYYAFGTKLKNLQSDYDKWTTIPVRDREQQVIWNRKISLQLDSLSNYR